MVYRFIALCLCLTVSLQAQPPKPATRLWVVDEAQKLNPWEEGQLSDALERLEERTSVEFVVATIQSLEGEDLEAYSHRWAESWGIGKAEKDNGLLLLIAFEDRKMRLEVGYGLESTLTDLESRTLLDEALRPALRKDDPFDGIAKLVARVHYLLGTTPSEELLAEVPSERQVQLRRDSLGRVLQPASIPQYNSDRIFMDTAGLFSAAQKQAWTARVESRFSPRQFKVLSIKELPWDFEDPKQLMAYLQKAWNFPKKAGNKELLMLFLESDQSLWLAGGKAYSNADLRIWQQRLWPALLKQYSFPEAAAEVVQQALRELPIAVPVGRAAWPLDLVKIAEPEVYELYEARLTDRAIARILLLLFLFITLIDWSLYGIKIYRDKQGSPAYTWNYTLKPWMRVLLIMAWIIAMDSLENGPSQLRIYEQIYFRIDLGAGDSPMLLKIGSFLYLYGIFYFLMTCGYYLFRVVGNSAGSSSAGSSSGYSSSSYSSYSSSSSSSSFGGGSFGGGGSSSSW